MSLTLAKKDLLEFQQNSGWAVDVTLTAPDTTTLDTTAFYSNHFLSVDADTGMAVNARNIHISFNRKDLVDNSYPFLNAEGDVDLTEHKILVESRTYFVEEIFPNQTLDLIVVILSEYE